MQYFPLKINSSLSYKISKKCSGRKNGAERNGKCLSGNFLMIFHAYSTTKNRQLRETYKIVSENF